MKYIVTLHYYKSGSGYSHSEVIESGKCAELFPASEWIKKSCIHPGEDEWIETEVNFYDEDADPMFDDPISTSKDNETICGKF